MGRNMMVEPTPNQRMEGVIRSYIQAFNDADAAAIAACFCDDAVLYTPSLKWSGAVTIGRNVENLVREQGYFWTADQIVVDVERCAATLEWTSFSRQHSRIVRGVEWFVFEPPTWGIQEIRTYYATPVQRELERQELLEFDYGGRGYPTTLPAESRSGEPSEAT